MHPTLIGLLRTTVKKVEEIQKLNPDDVALLELKRSILRAIAELELTKPQTKSTAA